MWIGFPAIMPEMGALHPCRLARGEVLALRAREFVQASVALGMTDRRVLVRHVLPNCLSPIIVTGSLTVATAILIAGL